MNILTPLQRHLDQVNEGRRKEARVERMTQYVFLLVVGMGGAYFLGHVLVYLFGV